MFGQQSGVKGTSQAPIEKGQPGTLIGVQEARIRIMFYFDDRGNATGEVLMEIDGETYAPPNSIEWFKNLRKVPKWQKKLLEKFDSKNAPFTPPAEDAVDVMGAGAVQAKASVRPR